MTISILGINHKTADLSMRGRFAFDLETLPETLADFCAENSATQVFLLSTCNRTEIYSNSPLLPEDILSWLEKVKAFPLTKKMRQTCFYFHSGKSALSHAIRVASSLDSLIMGEPEILGQLKKAYQASFQLGRIGQELSIFFNIVIRTAKKIRSHTGIGKCPVSMTYCSFHRAGTEKFHDSEILILGAGETAKKIIQHSIQAHPKSIKILNRTLPNAELLAEKIKRSLTRTPNTPVFSWGPLNQETLMESLKTADIVISTVQLSSESPPLVEERMLRFLKRQSPLLLIDLCSPRTLSKTVTQLPFVELIDIDEIQSFIEKNKHHRTQASAQAEAFIQEGIALFEKKHLAHQIAPEIVRLRKNIEKVVHEELQKALQALSQGKPSELTLKKLAHRLKQKWLHTPSKKLHSAAREGRDELLELTHEIFDL
jgi:glutamyl-tRNA reductase